MLGLRASRQPRRVGGQKRKWGLFVPAVLRQIEVHAADEVPRRILRPEEFLDGYAGRLPLVMEGRFQSFPQPVQYVSRKILRAGHRRNRAGEDFEFERIRTRN